MKPGEDAPTDTERDRRYEAEFRAIRASIEEVKGSIATAFAASEKAVSAALAAADRAVAAAMAAQEKAVTKAEVASDKRFEGVNEFRAQLADQQRTFMPRAEVDVLLGALGEKVSKLEGLVADQASRQIGKVAGYGWVVGLIMFALAVYGFFRR